MKLLRYTPPEFRANYLSFETFAKLHNALDEAAMECGSQASMTIELSNGYRGRVVIRAPRSRRSR